MRCTRCDGLALPQLLGRTPEGRLVFGWCRACLEEEDCAILDEPAAPLKPSGREPWRRRARRLARSARRAIRRERSRDSGRRLAIAGVAGLMTAWALILLFIGGWKLIARDDAKGPWLLFGSGLMAAMSLAFWVAMIGRSGGLRLVLKVIQVASAVAAFGTLAWAILKGDRRLATPSIAVVATALLVSWAARRLETRAPWRTERGRSAGDEVRRVG